MNLVYSILETVGGTNLRRLSALLGESEEKTGSAVSAAVPTLLAGMSRLTSSHDGAERLTSTLSQYDGDVAARPGTILSDPAAAEEQGRSGLNALFGSTASNGLATAVARFSGLGGDTIKRLLAYIAPLVLGGIARQFAGKTLSAQGLTSLFASQKDAIANALPRGLSLSDIPGLGNLTQAPRAAAAATRDVARRTSRLAPYAWALGALLLGLLLYQFCVSRKPAPAPAVAREVPVARVTDVSADFERQIATLTTTLDGVRDTATAEAAMPELRRLQDDLATTRAEFDRLSDADKARVRTTLAPALERLDAIHTRVRSSTSASDAIQPTIDAIMQRLVVLH